MYPLYLFPVVDFLVGVFYLTNLSKIFPDSSLNCVPSLTNAPLVSWTSSDIRIWWVTYCTYLILMTGKVQLTRGAFIMKSFLWKVHFSHCYQMAGLLSIEKPLSSNPLNNIRGWYIKVSHSKTYLLILSTIHIMQANLSLY